MATCASRIMNFFRRFATTVTCRLRLLRSMDLFYRETTMENYQFGFETIRTPVLSLRIEQGVNGQVLGATCTLPDGSGFYARTALDTNTQARPDWHALVIDLLSDLVVTMEDQRPVRPAMTAVVVEPTFGLFVARNPGGVREDSIPALSGPGPFTDHDIEEATQILNSPEMAQDPERLSLFAQRLRDQHNLDVLHSDETHRWTVARRPAAPGPVRYDGLDRDISAEGFASDPGILNQRQAVTEELTWAAQQRINRTLDEMLLRPPPIFMSEAFNIAAPPAQNSNLPEDV